MIRKVLVDVIRVQNIGNELLCISNEKLCISNEILVENELFCSFLRLSFFFILEFISVLLLILEQVDNYFWLNLEKYYRIKCYFEKNLDIFFFDLLFESIKCFFEFYFFWEKEEKIMLKESI